MPNLWLDHRCQDSGMSLPRVLIYTNAVVPYRVPIFEQIAETTDLTVAFAREKANDRLWQVRLESWSFQHAVLAHRTVKLGNSAQIINPDLLRYLWGLDFDVAIVGNNRQTALSEWMIALVTLIRSRPLIAWTGITRGENRFARSGHRLQQLFDLQRRLLFRRAAAIVAYGTATRQLLTEHGMPREKIFAGTQVMPSDQLPPPRTGSKEPGVTGKTVVLSVNYFVPRKGLDILITAFQEVAGPDHVLVLVGTGPEEEALRQLANGDHRIRFPGYQDGADKTAWYAAADLFVLPTLHDPWGLVVNEAMAFGLPIIATDAAGCAPDLVRDNGLVVPAGDINALAGALEQLLSDQSLRREMGERSRAIIADYTVNAACETFLDAITYALEKR